MMHKNNARCIWWHMSIVHMYLIRMNTCKYVHMQMQVHVHQEEDDTKGIEWRDVPEVSIRLCTPHSHIIYGLSSQGSMRSVRLA